MNKQPEITDMTKKHIRDAFWKLYKEYPMDSIKVSDVAAEAGVHRSTFYRYYHDTYEIYEQIETEELDAYEKLLREEASHGIINRERMGLFLNRVTVYLSERGEYFYYLFASGHSNGSMNVIYTRMRPLFFMLTGMKEGDVESEYYMSVLFQILFTNLTFWYTHRDGVEISNIAELCMPILQGIISREAYAHD